VVVADDAFKTHGHIVAPFAGHTLTPQQRNFNYHVSLLRCVVERAFALWKGKWGIFWRPLRMQAQNIKTVIEVTARLHNFCIDRACSVCPDDYAVYDDVFWTRTAPTKQPKRRTAPPPPYTGVVFPEADTIAAFFAVNPQARAKRLLRSAIMQYIEQQGYSAPLPPRIKSVKERRCGLTGAVRAPNGSFVLSNVLDSAMHAARV
jgi:hypothetical protein